MEDDRIDQDTGQGVVEKDFLSENVWRALILASAVAVLLFSVYCLSHGITTIFMHLYYFPIVLLAYRYRWKGFGLAMLLAIAYIGLVYFYNFGQADVIVGAWYRFIVFVGIAAVIAYLSEQLAAVHSSQEEALDTIQNLQQFQESIITNANVWIMVLAPDGTILVWNDAAEAIGGYKRGDVLGMKTVWKNLYPDKVYRQKVTRDIQRVIGRDTFLENFETEIRCADGTQKTIVWNTRGIRGPTGTILSYIAIGRDITEQKRVEKALRERETLLNEVGEMAHVGGWELDVGTKAVHWTPETYRIHDISEDERFDLSKAVLFFDLPGRSRLEGALQGCMETGEPFDLELPFTSAKGRHLWTRAIGRAVSVDGKVVKLEGAFQDITEHRQARVALRESENRYQNLYESSPDAIMTLEPPSWSFTTGNPATVQMFMARDETEFISKEPWALSPERQPDGRGSGDKAKEMIETAMRDGSHFFEWTHRRLNGEDFPATVLLSKVELGGKVFLQATVRDITEHKREEKALQESRERFRTMMNWTSDWEYWIAPDREVVYCSPSIESITGYSAEEFTADKALIDRIIHPDDHPLWEGHIQLHTVNQEEKKPFDIDFRIIAKDGSLRWIRHTCRAIFADDGRWIGRRISNRDITESKRADDALKESEERFRTIIHSMQFGIVVIDAQAHTILDANEKALEMIGGGTDGVVGSVCHRFICPAESGRCPVTDLGQTVDSSERVLLTLRGDKIPILKSVVTTTLGGKKVLIESFIDISERKQAEEKLKSSEELFKSLIETTGTGYVIVDTDGKVLDANPEYIRLTGYHTPEEIIGRSVVEWTAGYEVEKNTEAVKKCARDGYIRNLEIDYADLNGKITPVEINATVVQLQGTVKILTLCRDITERKRAEDALRESKALVEAVVENVPLMIFLKEATDLRFVIFNRAGEELLGYDRTALLGKNNLDLFPPDQAAQFMEKDREVLDGDAGMLDIPEEPITTAKKGLRLLHTRKVSIRGGDGTTKFLLGISEDITERKRAEDALRESNEYLRMLIDFANAPIIVWDPEFRITRFNHAFESLTGRVEHEVIGQPLDILFPKESRDNSLILIKKTLKGEHWETVEIPILTKEGSVRTVLWNSANILDPDGRMISTIAQGVDITERKQAEAELQKYSATLEQKVSERTESLNTSLKEKEVLLKEIHHRVRNNLQVVSSIISLQAKSVSDPGSLKQIQEIRMRIGTLALVHEIAYLSKTPDSINMRDFLYRCTSKVIDEFGCEPGRINITITAENVQVALSQAVPCSLIVNELLMNSIRHAFPGKRHGEIRIGFSVTKGNYVLEYGDDGVGLPEGMHPDKAETGGLALIQGLARQIRGTVESRTRPGTGYTLTFPAGIGGA